MADGDRQLDESFPLETSGHVTANQGGPGKLADAELRSDLPGGRRTHKRRIPLIVDDLAHPER
jgi:hypothetical protein